MGTKPEELKADIAERRRMMSEELGSDRRPGEPGQIVDRRRAAVRQRVSGWRETVMGAPGSGTNSSLGLSDRASNVGGQLSDAPDALRRRAQGNPLVAGLIVFGAGLLVASVLPESEPSAKQPRTCNPSWSRPPLKLMTWANRSPKPPSRRPPTQPKSSSPPLPTPPRPSSSRHPPPAATSRSTPPTPPTRYDKKADHAPPPNGVGESLAAAHPGAGPGASATVPTDPCSRSAVSFREDRYP